MKEYDVVVIGSGCGMVVVDEAINHGLRVALVDKGPLGGTCPNLGCIPSKTLILPADRIMEIEEARRVGIEAKVTRVDFGSIMERMRKGVEERQKEMGYGVTHSESLDFYEGEGHFVDKYTVEVKGEQVRGKKIVIAAGSRPAVPPILGLDSIDYHTNESVLQLKKRPDSLVIIGGGYIGVEYAHFFAAMGTTVTLVEMADRLVLSEEPEIAELLKDELSQRMAVYTGTAVDAVRKNEPGISVVVTPKEGKQKDIRAQQVMIATGRRSNADLLKVVNTGVKVNERGFVVVDEYLETTRKNIFAVGDINGKHMFTHTANRMAEVAANNIVHEPKIKMDYSAAPHAVFSYPQIAGVGLTEKEARNGHDILVGRTGYFDSAYGEVMMEKKGFAKAIVEKDTMKILGFHVIGPYAAIIIQEVINAMASGGHVREINAGIHIHPALPELIQRTVNSLEES
ncbi:MAG: dihydrolipoyl dehydrogenase [Chloroflexi bacterium]|nr:dihydrolipoyl dehydrogenase [Chloroflexota bacterium]